MIVLFQVCIIALITCLVFTTNYRYDDFTGMAEDYDNRENSLDDEDLKNALIAGAVISILTLPPCFCLLSCFRPKFVLDKNADSDEDYQREGGESDEDNEANKKGKKK